MFFYPMFIRYFLGNSQTKDKRNRELFSTKTSEEDWYSGNKAEVKGFFINWNKKRHNTDIVIFRMLCRLLIHFKKLISFLFAYFHKYVHLCAMNHSVT